MSVFIPANELKGNLGCVSSLSGAATLCLMEARNRGSCHWALAEAGFLMLAIASVVEAVVRIALAVVVPVLFVIYSPILCITDGPEQTCCKTLPKHIPELFNTIAYTGVRTAANSLTDMVALVKNLTTETLDYDKDLLPCSIEPVKLPEETALEGS